MSLDAERQAEAEIAERYRREAGEFRAEAADRRVTAAAECKALEERAADLIVLASNIERSHRGIDPLPAAGLPVSPER